MYMYIVFPRSGFEGKFMVLIAVFFLLLFLNKHVMYSKNIKAIAIDSRLSIAKVRY